MGRYTSIADRVRRAADNHESGGKYSAVSIPDGFERLETEEDMKIVILPFEVKCDHNPNAKRGEFHYEHTFCVHKDVGPEEKTIVCPTSFGKACVICAEHKRMLRNPNADKDELKTLRKKERQLFCVLDLNNKDKGVQIWDISYPLFGKLLDEEIKRGEPDIACFADLVGGKYMELRFSEEKIGKTKFLKCSKITFKDRKDYPESWLDAVIDPGTCLIKTTSEQVEKMFTGNTDDEVTSRDPVRGHDDDEDAPAPRKPAKRETEDDDDAPRANKPRHNDDDDDAPAPRKPSKRDEDGDDAPPPKKPAKRDEDEDDAPPARKPAKKDDDDDAPAPRRRRGGDEDDAPPAKPSKDEAPASGGKKCPFGHKFGTDFDTTRDCEDCHIFKKCKEASK